MSPRATLLLALFLPTLAFAQTTRPATKPTWLSLANGEIRYTAPEGWDAVPLANVDGLSAVFKSADGNAVITLHVTPQQQPLPRTPSVAQSLGRQILKAIKADLEKSRVEILEAPRLERDRRFFIRIRDRIRLNGITSDRLHLYRAMGYNLVQAAVVVDNQTPDQVKTAFAADEQLLDGAVIGKRDAKPADRRERP